MNTQGKVFKYPDNVDTDVIIPARYLNTPNAQELALHCMEDIDKAFVKKVEKGDVIVAGWNFGCGSSREHAPLVIKTWRHGCVIAKTLRVFSTATPSISACRFSSARKRQTRSTQTTKFLVDFDTGIITDITTGKTYKAQPFPPFIQNIIKAGGLLKSLKEAENK